MVTIWNGIFPHLIVNAPKYQIRSIASVYIVFCVCGETFRTHFSPNLLNFFIRYFLFVLCFHLTTEKKNATRNVAFVLFSLLAKTNTFPLTYINVITDILHQSERNDKMNIEERASDVFFLMKISSATETEHIFRIIIMILFFFFFSLYAHIKFVYRQFGAQFKMKYWLCLQLVHLINDG